MSTFDDYKLNGNGGKAIVYTINNMTEDPISDKTLQKFRKFFKSINFEVHQHWENKDKNEHPARLKDFFDFITERRYSIDIDLVIILIISHGMMVGNKQVECHP